MSPRAAPVSPDPPAWGRVLIAGGTDWATNGKGGKRSEESDLREPHILRAVSHFKVTKVLAGCSANYGVAIDIQGIAHMFGKLPALSSDPKGLVPLFDAVHVSPRHVGLDKDVKWIDGALGRSHFLFLDSDGGVWGAGINTIGQLGLPVCNEVPTLTKVKGPWGRDRIIQVTAGNTFSLFLSDKGQVYSTGSSEHGQLGNGVTGERIVKGGKTAFDSFEPARITGLDGKKIVQIASGNQHSLALDDEGYVYAWGNAGYVRLGLGDQKDKLVPTLIPQFADSNPLKRAKSVFCGPTSSVIIDCQDLFTIAGKWKLTGEGSVGQVSTSFKYIDLLSGCKVIKVALGGATHFITTYGQHGIQTIGWGQGALYGELGFGREKGKSSSIPIEIDPLKGLDVIDVAGGMFFSLFLVHPNEKMTDIDRCPLQLASSPTCVVCNEDNDELLLECERCDEPYHTTCLQPKLDAVPEGEWFCPECTKQSNRTFDDEPIPTSAEVASPGGSAPKRPASSQGGDAGQDTKRMRAD